MDQDRWPIEGSEITHGAGAKAVRDVAPAQPVEVTIVVRRRPGSEISREQILSGRFQPVSREEFAARHGADPNDLAAVERFATEYGLTVVGSDAAQRTVRVTGSTEALGRAFGVNLAYYEGPHGPVISYEGTLSVPASLKGVVEQVLGLDQRPIAHRFGG
jgi:kumamolisin